MKSNIEGDVYDLSPMQTGMLFQALYNPGQGLDIEQLVCKLDNNVDAAALKFAWERVWETYEILRTGFTWQGNEQPTQKIHQSLPLLWEQLDWSNTPGSPQQQLNEFLCHDRKAGFNLAQPPLMRLTLIKAKEGNSWLIWTYHHILLDGRSLPILLRQMARAYQAYSEGEFIVLEPTRSYRDYIAWLEEQDWSSAKTYWKERMQGLQHATTLDVSNSQSHLSENEQSYDVLKVSLTPELTNSLKQLADENSLTLNTILQGAWAILLNRYTGEQDVLFGAIRTGRYSALNGQGANEIVGLLINTLPVRVRVDSQSPALQILKSLRASTLELHKTRYDHVSLSEIQKLYGLQSGGRPFESILAYENLDFNETLKDQHPILNGWHFELLEHIGYPLVIRAYGGECIKLSLEYDRSMFDSATIHRIVGHLQVLLKGIVDDVTCPIYLLPLLTNAEQQQILTEWNNNSIEYAPDKCIHELFEAQAEHNPNAIALVFEDKQVTYQELNQRANQLAHYLVSQGVKRETIVALYMERSLEIIVAVLGILKAGGAYLPIDTVYPPERISFMLEDSHTSFLLTQEDRLSTLPAFQGNCLCLDTQWDLLARYDSTNLTNNTQPQDLAYVIYTSGSTGKPKGVLITHYNIVRLFQATQEWYHFSQDDVWTMFHSYAFDFSVWEIWGALTYGGKLIIVPYLVSRSPELFYRLLINEGVTVLNQTPSAFYQLIKAEEAIEPPIDLKLRYVIFGGEALDLQALRPWFMLHGDQKPQLINMYGITETTVHVTYRPINTNDLETRKGSVIGSPIPDLQVYILSSYNQLCPIGVKGEIYVSGAGVGRGYLNRPELSSERFIQNPFNAGTGSYLYKSGDLARLLPNGDMEYLGRADFQVKIRGFRVELGEIESVLSSHPAIQNVVIVTRLDNSGSKQLIAYLLHRKNCKPEIELTTPKLREFLKKQLPNYMVPAFFVVLESFPLTSNGKVDRQALPTPAFSTPEEQFVQPQTPIEKKLAKLWSELLSIEEIGINDNFFDLGGHSLLAMRLLNRLQDIFSLDLPLRLLFEAPTIADLAKQIENLLWAAQQNATQKEGGDSEHEEMIL